MYIDRAKNAMSATVTNQTVKDMFVASGMILEIYCFFEACKTCLFDDVQTGYRFNWEFDDVTNELDLVLTKGYRSILIECKSIASVDEGIYLTLDSLGDHFGINYAKILILVTDTTTPSYGQFVSSGNQMDIITISTRKELEKIFIYKIITLAKAMFGVCSTDVHSFKRTISHLCQESVVRMFLLPKNVVLKRRKVCESLVC
jgi:hypothetical protein